MQAQYPVKVQAIRSKGRTDRYYVFVPLPLAAAIGLEAGEEIQWSLTDKNTLSVQRVNPPVKSAIVEGAKKGTKTKRK
jgi:hypothetical protein